MPSLLDRALNVGEAKKYKAYQKRVALIGAFEAELEHDSDAELRERMDALRERARSGERAEMPRDQCEFGGKGRIGHRIHGRFRFAG